MRRLFGVLAVAAAIAAAPAVAAGQATKTQTPPKPAAPTPKALSASGSVTKVSGDSITVKGKTAEWTFTVDKETSVTAKGATHKNLALKAENKLPMLTDFVKNGDTVTVSYHDMGATKHAAVIRVTAPAK
jgi:hypothetical protein